MGILTSHVGALLIKDLINHEKNEYKDIFNLRRKLTIQKISNSVVNIYESINGYYKGIIEKNNLDKVCHHAKCKLLYNKEEKT